MGSWGGCETGSDEGVCCRRSYSFCSYALAGEESPSEAGSGRFLTFRVTVTCQNHYCGSWVCLGFLSSFLQYSHGIAFCQQRITLFHSYFNFLRKALRQLFKRKTPDPPCNSAFKLGLGTANTRCAKHPEMNLNAIPATLHA